VLGIMGTISPPGRRRDPLLLSEVPPAPRTTAESGTRRIDGRSYVPPPALDPRPTPEELEDLDEVLDALLPLTSETLHARWHRALCGGAYTSVLEELATLCRETPRNRTLQLLHERMHEVVTGVLRARLGPSTRKLLACEHEGRLTPGMQRIVDAAREPITVAELLRTVGGEELAVIERIVRLMQHGWLLACRTSSGANPAERGTR
jgi:hypothetical protein